MAETRRRTIELNPLLGFENTYLHLFGKRVVCREIPKLNSITLTLQCHIPFLEMQLIVLNFPIAALNNCQYKRL